MLLTDFYHLDGFLADHPPLDILAAAWLGVKPRGAEKPTIREAARMNSEALAQLPARRNVRKLEDMPAFLRTPEQLAMIESVKTRAAEWKSSE